MPSGSKKPSLFSRFVPSFGRRSNTPAFGGSRAAAGIISRTDHTLTSSMPELVPGGAHVLQCHESQPQTPRPSGSENETDNSSAPSISTSSNHDSNPLQPSQSLPISFGNSPAGQTTFFPGASGFQIRDFHVANHYMSSGTDRSVDGWELLLTNTAPNALHDSDARYDPPKCDEDTRVEVTGEIVDWIKDREGPQRLMCMTGAAGSGKSALQQTTAEICQESGILGATFFFSTSDSTRNTVKRVIPTIAYQLGRTNDTLRRCIKGSVENDPLVFSKSLRTQVSTLIVEPSQCCKRMGMNLTTLPYAIFIDGLDECTGEDRQAELLVAVRECLLVDDLPFRVFIASRPEWAIRTALEPGGHLSKLAYHIQLSDQYDASADMGRYLRRRFEDIGLHIRDPKWFSESDIDILIGAGSGQFIYVATVYKYVSERRASPAERLKVLLTWTPHESQPTRPFEALDRLYTNIMLAAMKAYEAVDTHHGRDFLLLFRVYHVGVTGFYLKCGYTIKTRPPANLLSALLCLETRAEESLITDLRSLVDLKKGRGGKLRLHLYHKSFSDFLEEPSRARDLYLPESRVYAHLAKCFLKHIVECPLDFESLPEKWKELPLPVIYRRSLMGAVEDLPVLLNYAPAIDEEIEGFTQNGGWQKINNLLPLLYGPDTWLFNSFDGWIDALNHFTDQLKTRKPEVAAVIDVFVGKWKNNK